MDHRTSAHGPGVGGDRTVDGAMPDASRARRGTIRRRRTSPETMHNACATGGYMNDVEHARSSPGRRAAGPSRAAGLAVIMALILGGCVSAGSSAGAPTPAVTPAPPVAVTSEPPSPSATNAPAPTPSAPSGGPAATAACASPGDSVQACRRASAAPAPAATPAATHAATRTPAPTATPTPGTATSSVSVTQADNGTTLHLAVGQQFLLDLGSSEDWAVTVANQDVVSRVIGVLVVKGAQGIYAARASGTTVLSAIGSPHCTSGVCPLFRIAFKVTITVD